MGKSTFRIGTPMLGLLIDALANVAQSRHYNERCNPGTPLAPIKVLQSKASGAVWLRKLPQAAENHAAQSRSQQADCAEREDYYAI